MARAQKMLTDEHGNEYLAKIIDPAIVKRDAVVNRVMKRAVSLHEKLTRDKEKMASDIERYLDQTAERYDETWKGNDARTACSGTAS